MYYITDEIINQIEQLKRNSEFDKALDIVNGILIKDPTNKIALLQIADIQYMKGEIEKAEKPIDFILNNNGENDTMGLYVKGVLEMEKTNWNSAKNYLKKALENSNIDNPEIIRCYGLSEYWSGNREKGIDYLTKAFNINNLDAEIIYNIIEIELIEHKYKDALKMIKYYHKNRENLETFGNNIEYYDQRIALFSQYLSKIQQ